ncbi:MAG: hypothetical protein JWP19_887 [Rhodoglobus sp.]|nr:hypothetical protein [Rhodoglobus sp.]
MDASRLKLLAILAGGVLGALTLIAWTQPWFALTLTNGRSLAVAGQVAAPALSALGLASLALVAALAIAGRVFRVVLAAVEVVIGVLVVVSAAAALSTPVAASAATITDAVGESGANALAALVASVSATAWPYLALAFGALSALVGVAVLATTRRWPGPTRRYEATAVADDSAAGNWDALSAGEDPTR